MESIILNEYSKIANDGITDNELKKAKSQISSDISFSRDGSYAIAGALNEALAIGDWKFYTNFIENINNVSAKDVQSIVKKYLVRAFKDGKDMEARSNMLCGSSMGSTAFQKGLGAIHSLSHPVNSQFNIHHGLSNAIFMPYVLTFNKNLIEKRIVSICDYCLEISKNWQFNAK